MVENGTTLIGYDVLVSFAASLCISSNEAIDIDRLSLL